MSKMVKWY